MLTVLLLLQFGWLQGTMQQCLQTMGFNTAIAAPDLSATSGIAKTCIEYNSIVFQCNLFDLKIIKEGAELLTLNDICDEDDVDEDVVKQVRKHNNQNRKFALPIVELFVDQGNLFAPVNNACGAIAAPQQYSLFQQFYCAGISAHTSPPPELG